MKNRLSFALRAVLLVAPALTAACARPAQAQSATAVREIEVVVDGGYQPARIVVKQGEHVRLRFVRKDYGGCSREVVFPSLGIRRELPTNQPVLIDLPALPVGTVDFHCGMNMIRGVIEVKSR